jgi:c-di-GMP-related signal transduction protein
MRTNEQSYEGRGHDFAYAVERKLGIMISWWKIMKINKKKNMKITSMMMMMMMMKVRKLVIMVMVVTDDEYQDRHDHVMG